MNLVNKIAFILVIVGALNWGLYAFDQDLVALLPDVVAKVVYVLVALSAIVLLFAKNGKSETASAPKDSMSQGPTM